MMPVEKNDSNDGESLGQQSQRHELIRAFNMLRGILEGINIDEEISGIELDELVAWCNSQKHLAHRAPFNEIFPAIDRYAEDGVLTKEEYDDILWLCSQFQRENEYEDIYRLVIQELHGVLYGILADNIVTEQEAFALSHWLDDNEVLKGLFPFDEIYSLLSYVLSDGILDEEEAKVLKDYFSEFLDMRENDPNQIELNKLKKQITVKGICAISPDIVFENRTFCFTGKSCKTTKDAIAKKVSSLGANYSDDVTAKTDFLIVGDGGNPCWAYSCYGRKVEEAVLLRKTGNRIQIIHEHDLWDVIGEEKLRHIG